MHVSLSKDKTTIVQHIINCALMHVDVEKQSGIAHFIEHYCSGIPDYDLEAAPIETLAQSILHFWHFVKERPSGAPKVRIFNHKTPQPHGSAHHTIIELVNDDMPFLVDSLIGTLNTLGLAAHQVVHPVIQVARSASGHIESIVPPFQSGQTPLGSFESFIHCEIAEPSSPQRLHLLQQEIEMALTDVRAAVGDFLPMRQQIKDVISVLDRTQLRIPSSEKAEVISFLHWLNDNHFTFLGYCAYDFVPQTGVTQRHAQTQDGLGILRDNHRGDIKALFEGIPLNPANRRMLVEPYPLIITKTTEQSRVHRRDAMDAIGIKRYDEQGHVIGFVQFLGLFTSSTYNKSPREIPILRQKIDYVLERSGFSPQWHDGKALIHILESFPREELFQCTDHELYIVSLSILQLQDRQQVKVFVRPDRFERYVSCLVYIPRDRYNAGVREKVGVILEESFEGKVSHVQTQLGDLAFARVQYSVLLNQQKLATYSLNSIEQQIADATLTWQDRLSHQLVTMFGDEEGDRLFFRYHNAFSQSYQEAYGAEEAIESIKKIERYGEHQPIWANVETDTADPSSLRLKIFSGQGSLILSDVLPMLENLDLRVINESPYVIKIKDRSHPVWLHEFTVQPKSTLSQESLNQVHTQFIQALYGLWSHAIENDGFNRLILRAGLSAHDITILRAYSKYQRHLLNPFSQPYVEETLIKYPDLVRLLMDLFHARFHPHNKSSDTKEVRKNILRALDAIASPDEDRILRRYLNLIMATLRTNFYQTMPNGAPKDYLSFKFSSQNIDDLPSPKPVFEIFVYSPKVEAIHLRGGKVARGGIRWSDRKEDFRTEVLGLVKAQMVKNAVIVPVGSKGGFIIKQPLQTTDRAALLQQGIECYQTMMRGLLDLTDNIIDGKIIHPLKTVRHDDDDSYLVVAADKGTATFSDYANAISGEYNFWLGDAFASGGSVGYDHKKMGITARGAWESVKRHFKEMNKDPEKDVITAIGVGDMAGDVFGNGMLLSKTMKLLAAFNHMHIFIDPDPDPQISFLERERLFYLPRSTWADYDVQCLSKGAAIFERSAKTITLTQEIRERFHITAETLSPNELVRTLLRAEVDLLWLGGIGTYIKSKAEANSDVGDKANDAVRVNGSEMRCKVLAEGANLGVTQLGRIEYGRFGGRINTDAIDNSAGVDTSDHEVNIKILLNDLMKKGTMTFEQRNTFLQTMTDEVGHLVLRDNYWQNQAISVAQMQGVHLLSSHISLMRELERHAKLDRALEFLPSDEELAFLQTNKKSLTRPELSVLLAYAKINLYQELLESDLPDSPLVEDKLITYFPEPIQKKFLDQILTHPLRREIVATCITNSMVNRMGPTFVNDVNKTTGKSSPEIVQAYLTARKLFNLSPLWKEIETLGDTAGTNVQKDCIILVNQFIQKAITWLLRNTPSPYTIQQVLMQFAHPIASISHHFEKHLPAPLKADYQQAKAGFIGSNIPEKVSTVLASLPFMPGLLDIVKSSQYTKINAETILPVYFSVSASFNLKMLQKTIVEFPSESSWQQAALLSLLDDVHFTKRAITEQVLAHASDDIRAEKKVQSWGRENEILVQGIQHLIEDLAAPGVNDLAMLSVITREIRGRVMSSMS